MLIVETWHPALTRLEQRAMSDLFALRDLFGRAPVRRFLGGRQRVPHRLLEFKRAPFGISDEAATSLLESGGGVRLDDWRLL